MFISIVLVSCSIDKICDCCCKGSCYCDSMKCGCASETAVIVDSLVNLNFNCKICCKFLPRSICSKTVKACQCKINNNF